METVWGESEPVKTNMKIIDPALLLDSYDWCLRCNCESALVALGWLSYLSVSDDAVLSAESTELSGGLQPLHVLKAFNLPSQLAEDCLRNGKMSPWPCVMVSTSCLLSLPFLHSPHSGTSAEHILCILLPPSKPHSKY